MTRPETLDRKFTSKLPPPALEFIKLLLSLDSTKRPTCIEVGRGCRGSSLRAALRVPPGARRAPM